MIGGDEKRANNYRNVIRRNRAEAKEHAISASVSPKVERVIRDFSREHGQADPFPEGSQKEGIKLVKV